MIDLARVDLAPEVGAPVFGGGTFCRRQAGVHVLVVDDPAALPGKIHRREISRPSAILKNVKKGKKCEKPYYNRARIFLKTVQTRYPMLLLN